MASSIVFVLDPEIELVDAALAFKARPLPGLTVQNETALRCIDHPVALITRGAHGGKWAAHFCDVV